MEAVRELKRKFIITWRQGENIFRLSFPVVSMRIVGWNDLTGGKEVLVDQNMVMSGAFNNLTCGLDFHSLHAHDDFDRPLDLCAVLWFYKEYFALGCFFLPTSDDDEKRNHAQHQKVDSTSVSIVDLRC